MKKTEISTAELEKLTGLTESRLRQLAVTGAIPSPSAGVWPNPQTIQQLFRHYRSRGELKPIEDAKLRKTEAEASIAELELDRARRRLLPAVKVERYFGDVLTTLRSGILNSSLSNQEQRELLFELQRLLQTVPDDLEPEPTTKPR